VNGYTDQDAFVLLQRAAAAVQGQLVQLLKPHGLSPTQYNVLRILRGARPELLSCGDIASRLIAKDPDLTRLLDRLDRQGWVERKRGQADRRVVRAGITAEGLTLLKSLDSAVAALHRRQFAPLGEKKSAALAKLLAGLA
jgi:DNA-binding MarR family transcriptional regulator